MLPPAQKTRHKINLLDPRMGNPMPAPVKTAQIRTLLQCLHQIVKTVHQGHKNVITANVIQKCHHITLPKLAAASLI